MIVVALEPTLHAIPHGGHTVFGHKLYKGIKFIGDLQSSVETASSMFGVVGLIKLSLDMMLSLRRVGLRTTGSLF